MFIRILTVFGFLFFFYVIFQMTNQTVIGKFFSDAAGAFPFKDKGLHFILMLTLSVLLNCSLKCKKITFQKRHYLVGSLILLVFISVEELSQAFIPVRNFEMMDMLCNYAGIYAGGLLLLLMPNDRFKRKETKNDHYSSISVPTIFHRTR